MFELAEESGESEYEDEIKTMLNELQQKFEHLNILNLLSGEVDGNSAFISIHSGAGGTEAEDWAAMLSRMYSRWAERHGYKIEIVDQLEAEGGIKSITMQIEGDYVYGHLKGEAGIHRLVRISPFDSNARRHTSFSSVYVFPVLDDSIEVDIRSEDLRIDTYRAGGKGGQHVNKTESAVRFTHIPTGIVVACQSERSQLMNRQSAMSILKAKVYEYYRQKKEEENQKFSGEKKDISWGNQIRSYVFRGYRIKASVGADPGISHLCIGGNDGTAAGTVLHRSSALLNIFVMGSRRIAKTSRFIILLGNVNFRRSKTDAAFHTCQHFPIRCNDHTTAADIGIFIHRY